MLDSDDSRAFAVSRICDGFFQRTGANCFSYSRVYSDGSRTELWSDADAMRHTFLKRPYIIGAYTPTYYKHDERYVFLEEKISEFSALDRRRYSAQLSELRNVFGYSRPLKIVNNLIGYCEYFIYYVPTDCQSVVGSYIKDIAVFDNFSRAFEGKATPFIEQADRERIVPTRDENFALQFACDCHGNSAAEVYGCSRDLTSRQIEIGRLLLHGFTAKEISCSLAISSRTVESHIESIKSKMGCNRRSELIIKLSAHISHK